MAKKPLYKKIYHGLVKPLIKILTLRMIRKPIQKKIHLYKLKKQIVPTESNFSENTVLIFQHQFFDMDGKVCFNGGAERYVVDLADVLVKCGYKPILIQRGNKNLPQWKRTVGNLEIIGLSIDPDDYTDATKQFKNYKFVIYSGAIGWGRNLLHPNILISHGITWDTHDIDVDTKMIFNIFKDVDKFVSVDTNTISWLRTTFSRTLKDFDANYIPNYVDTKTYFPKSRKKDNKIHITFPRRSSPERGYWLMSAALPPILDKYPDVVFKFVGFAHGKEIQQDILNLEEKYKGRVSHCMVNPDEMPKIYQDTDISLIPTIYCEGTSLSCLEAQACGNVVISTNIGGLPNLIIDGYNGLLINPNGQDLMKAIDKVLTYKELRENLSQNAVLVAHAFDKKIWQQKWEKIIEQYGD